MADDRSKGRGQNQVERGQNQVEDTGKSYKSITEKRDSEDRSEEIKKRLVDQAQKGQGGKK